MLWIRNSVSFQADEKFLYKLVLSNYRVCFLSELAFLFWFLVGLWCIERNVFKCSVAFLVGCCVVVGSASYMFWWVLLWSCFGRQRCWAGRPILAIVSFPKLCIRTFTYATELLVWLVWECMSAFREVVSLLSICMGSVDAMAGDVNYVRANVNSWLATWLKRFFGCLIGNLFDDHVEW